MLSLLNKVQKNGARAGIVIGERELALAVMQRRSDAKPLLLHCATHSLGGGPASDVLPSLISKHNLGRVAMSAVMAPEEYQLVQVEAPDVLPAELRAAVRWRLRELINFQIDDAIVDVFDIPDQSRRAQAKMMFAVAAHKSAVQHIGSLLAPHARSFDVIDIPELCLRNVTALLPQDQRGLALLSLNDSTAHLIVTRNGVLYLARRIELENVGGNASDPDTNVDAAELGLQLQRSLDYYESHYDQPAITDVIVAPADGRARAFAAVLSKETSLRVATIDLPSVVDSTTPLPATLPSAALMAIGAALRVENVQL